MGKFDFTDTIDKIQNSFKGDDRRASQIGLGSALVAVSNNPEDYVVMPDWWKENYGVLGLRFGHFVQIAGEPDSGKTSLSLLAMKAAQEQGYAVLYVETEDKTSEKDLLDAGIDPDQIMTVRTNITEEAFDNANLMIDAFFDKYPTEKLLVVYDSYGNTTSMRDSELKLTENDPMYGGHAKTNRAGLSIMRAKQAQFPMAVLFVNYTIDNQSGYGKTNAGGKALNLFSMLTIQSSRKAWYEKQVNGVKVRAGADVLWKTYKNHYAKALKDDKGNSVLLPGEITLRISGDGFKRI